MFALLALTLAPIDLPADGWIGFEQAAVDGTTTLGCDGSRRTSIADDDHAWNIHNESGETFERITVYIEFRDGEATMVNAFTPDCVVTDPERARRMQLDEQAAVTLLASLLDESGTRRFTTETVATLAHIANEDAGTTLARLAADDDDEDLARDALFWLAARRGDYGRDVVAAHLEARWPLEHREHAVMSLALSEHPDALDIVRKVAREASPADLRAQAVVGLGIVDAPGALADLHSILLVETSEKVREQAIFALSQLDKPGAAQILADIVRDPRNGELRRTALFWLTQMDGEESQQVIDALMEEVF